MSYNSSPLCMATLAAAGYLKEGDNGPRVDMLSLDRAIKELFPVVVDNSVNEFAKVGLSVDQIVASLFPDFYPSTEVTPDERDDPEVLLEVLEKDAARREMEKLVWIQASVTSNGRVQKLFGLQDPPLVLVEATVERLLVLPDGSASSRLIKVKVRFATANPDIINNNYIHERGIRLMGIAKAVSEDVAMAIARIPGAEEYFKATFGLEVDIAIMSMKRSAGSRSHQEN